MNFLPLGSKALRIQNQVRLAVQALQVSWHRWQLRASLHSVALIIQ